MDRGVDKADTVNKSGGAHLTQVTARCSEKDRAPIDQSQTERTNVVGDPQHARIACQSQLLARRNVPGWVITGVHCVHYTKSDVPRTWAPKQMQETDPEVAALVESEDEGK
eukprot:890493-Prymnesium_polylepis.2